MISIHPYLRNSASVVSLLARAQERGIPMKVRIKTAPKKGIIVNWGLRQPTQGFAQGCMLRDVPEVNKRLALHTMTDKLRFFRHVGHDSGLVPEWTDSRDVAAGWDGDVVVRLKTAASGGEGLSIWSKQNGVPLVAAPLYTRYVKKAEEYRCHMFRDEEGGFFIGLSQRKAAKRNEAGEPVVKDWRVRNLDNGFIFAKNDGHVLPPVVVECCTNLMLKHFPELDFVALDVVYNKHDNKAYVLEGNAAPGLEGGTLDLYLDYFVERLNAL